MVKTTDSFSRGPGVQLPVPTWQLITDFKSGSRESEILLWVPWVPGYAHGAQSYM